MLLLALSFLACGALSEPFVAPSEPAAPSAGVEEPAVPQAAADEGTDERWCSPGLGLEQGRWHQLAAGVEYLRLQLQPPPPTGCGQLDVVRVDAERARVVAYLASMEDVRPRSAGDWCRATDMVVVTNLGMYDTDFVSHVGYARQGEHVDRAGWVADYKSVLLLDPAGAGAPRAEIRDHLDGGAERYADWRTVIQNLRLVAAPGRNVWSEGSRRWAEAALAQDGQGRLLFLHTRAAFTMAELNRRLLALPLDIVRAQHLEGGPEASLSICLPDHRLDLSGSLETGFFDDSNRHQWAIPNVLGVELGS